MTWRDLAECAYADPELFEPLTQLEALTVTHRGARSVDRIAIALSYCAVCPVVVQCRRDGLGSVDYPREGVYGGECVSAKQAQVRYVAARASAGLTGRRVSAA
jgi:hypothetical protein